MGELRQKMGRGRSHSSTSAPRDKADVSHALVETARSHSSTYAGRPVKACNCVGVHEVQGSVRQHPDLGAFVLPEARTARRPCRPRLRP